MRHIRPPCECALLVSWPPVWWCHSFSKKADMERSAFSPKELHREAALVLREGSSEFCALTTALSPAL